MIFSVIGTAIIIFLQVNGTLSVRSLKLSEFESQRDLLEKFYRPRPTVTPIESITDSPQRTSLDSFASPIHIPLIGLSPAFSNSFLVFRGETSLFNFEEVQSIGAPYLHISSKAVKIETDTYKRLKSLNLTDVPQRTINHQVIVYGVSLKTPVISYQSREKLAAATTLPILPLTLIVLSDSQRAWRKHLGIGGGVFTLYWKKQPLISFLLTYDPSAGTTFDGYVFCTICLYQKHMGFFPPSQHWTHPDQDFSIKFQWNWRNVAGQLESGRRNITEDGRNVIWNLRSYDLRFYLGRNLIAGDEFVNTDTRSRTPPILRLHEFHIAIIKVLFPLKTTTYTASCTVLTDCVDAREAFCLRTTNEPMSCSNRGVSNIALGTPGQGKKKRILPFEYDLERKKLHDQEVIFITSERVRYTKGDSVIHIFLSVYSATVWLILGALMTITSLLLTCSLIQNKEETQLRHDFGYYSTQLGLKAREMMETVCYLSAGFLGQCPRALPHLNPAKTKSRYTRISRSYLVPWVLGTWVLTNWYTAFMRSSFNFPFPYELELNHWKDFENLSLYIFYDRRMVLNMSSTQVSQIKGEWVQPLHRKLLLLDAHNVQCEEGVESEDCLLQYIYMPISSKVLFEQLYNCRSCYSFTETYYGGLEAHPIVLWFRYQLDSMFLCLKRIRQANKSEEMLMSKCGDDYPTFKRTFYRLDLLHPKELSLYVGNKYRNVTSWGRKIGEELIQHIGNFCLEHCIIAEQIAPKLDHVTDLNNKNWEHWEHGNTFYWMTRQAEAAFVVPKSEFPWYWNLFKKIMLQDPSIKFSHTGPKEMKKLRPGGGFGNGVESPIELTVRTDYYAPEARWLQGRIRALQHSGIFDFLAKWDLMIYPPIQTKHNEFLEETVGGVQALSLVHDEVNAIFIVFVYCVMLAVAMFLVELISMGGVKAARYVTAYLLK